MWKMNINWFTAILLKYYLIGSLRARLTLKQTYMLLKLKWLAQLGPEEGLHTLLFFLAPSSWAPPPPLPKEKFGLLCAFGYIFTKIFARIGFWLRNPQEWESYLRIRRLEADDFDFVGKLIFLLAKASLRLVVVSMEAEQWRNHQDEIEWPFIK